MDHFQKVLKPKQRLKHESLHEWVTRKCSAIQELSAEQQEQVLVLFHRLLIHQIALWEFRRKLLKIIQPQAKNLESLTNNEKEIYAKIWRLNADLLQDPEMVVYYKLGLLQYLAGNFQPFEYMRVKIKPLVEMLAKYKLQPAPVSLREFNVQAANNLFAEISPELQAFIKGLVLTKLRFVFNSNRFDAHDFQSELYCKALTSFRELYPFYSKEHIVRACKVTLKNTGLNLVTHYSRKKRQRLHAAPDSYYNTTLTLDSTEAHQQIYQNSAFASTPTDQDFYLSLEKMQDVLNEKQWLAIKLIIAPEEPPADFLDKAETLFQMRVNDYTDLLRKLHSREGKLHIRTNALLWKLVREYCKLNLKETQALKKELKSRIFT